MASCSDDLDAGKAPGQVLENETTTFVRISIQGVGNNPNSRATPYEEGYEDGLASENEVKSLMLYFYDAARNYVGHTPVDLTNAKKEDGNGNTVEKMITVVAQVDLPENINYPKYVVAYVNPTSAASDLGTEKLEDIMGIMRARKTVSHLTDDQTGSGYRTMNNSVFFSNATGNSRFATEVDFKTQFFESYAKAEAAENATIEITVERVEAKVRTSINGVKLNDFTSKPGNDTEDAYTMSFVPEAWFVNATEKNTFLIKNYRETRKNYTANIPSTELDFGFNLSALNARFVASYPEGAKPAKFSVNDFDNQRSYWAISPTYYYSDVANTNDLYPNVSYDVKYGETINTNGKSYPLEYISYEDGIKGYKGEPNKGNYIAYGADGVKTHEYVLENTMSINTLRGTDAKAAMTSVVILGHYVIKQNGQVVFDGSTPASGKPETKNAFYVRHEADKSKVVLLSDEDAINFFIERSGSTFFVRERDKDGNLISTTDGEGNISYNFVALRAAHLDPTSDKNENHVNYGVSHADFELVYPTTDITNNKVQSEQWRTLGLKLNGNKANEELYVFDSASNTYVTLNSFLVDAKARLAFRERMYSAFGVLEKFQAGKAYFNVPLKHIWASNFTSNDFKADEVRLGDYGVVRNHIYDLTINSIGGGLGTGIGDIRQPIVPPTENEQYYISTRLNILKWKVVGQSIDL